MFFFLSQATKTQGVLFLGGFETLVFFNVSSIIRSALFIFMLPLGEERALTFMFDKLAFYSQTLTDAHFNGICGEKCDCLI